MLCTSTYYYLLYGISITITTENCECVYREQHPGYYCRCRKQSSGLIHEGEE